jgi:hypothetical protein
MRIVVALVLAGLTLAPALAEDEWRETLRREIAAAESCELALLSQIVERRIGGVEVVLAKAHCADGRVFDARRSGGPIAPFVFSPCDVTRDARSC